MGLLSSSLGDDAILSILSTPCSLQRGLHSLSLYREKGGAWWAPAGRLPSLLGPLSCVSLGQEKAGAASSARPGWAIWKVDVAGSEGIQARNALRFLVAFVSLCWLATACRICGWSQDPSGSVVREVGLVVLFWVQGFPASAESP